MSTLKKAGSSADWLIVLLETPDARDPIADQMSELNVIDLEAG